MGNNKNERCEPSSDLCLVLGRAHGWLAGSRADGRLDDVPFPLLALEAWVSQRTLTVLRAPVWGYHAVSYHIFAPLFDVVSRRRTAWYSNQNITRAALVSRPVAILPVRPCRGQKHNDERLSTGLASLPGRPVHGSLVGPRGLAI